MSHAISERIELEMMESSARICALQSFSSGKRELARQMCISSFKRKILHAFEMRRFEIKIVLASNASQLDEIEVNPLILHIWKGAIIERRIFKNFNLKCVRWA